MNTPVLPLISDIARLMRRSFDARVRDLGVTRPQWQVLTALNNNEGINQGGLAERLDVEPITVCRMVDRLQEADLVERRPDPADRRSWRLFLTPEGRAIVDRLRPRAAELQDELLEGLGEPERASLVAMLETIRTNLTRRPSAPNEPDLRQTANG